MNLTGTLGRIALVWACVVSVAVCSAQPPDKGAEDKKPAAKEAPATLIVKVVEDATLLVEGTPTKSSGPVRKYLSPVLTPGKVYTYTLTAKWEPNNYTKITRTRKAKVEAGKTIQVDLTEKDPKIPDDIVIRYVPTPQEVVDAMLEMGKVGKDDVVYDLGCGDGRIVVTAVTKFNAKRGVGVDLDPERIKDSQITAREAKATDKVEFREGDVMKQKDLGDASVVMLYLGNDLNEQLRPILQKQLKPGSRIVSHRFLMGSWKPQKSKTLTVDGEDYDIHLWIVGKE